MALEMVKWDGWRRWKRRRGEGYFCCADVWRGKPPPSIFCLSSTDHIDILVSNDAALMMKSDSAASVLITRTSLQLLSEWRYCHIIQWWFVNLICQFDLDIGSCVWCSSKWRIYRTKRVRWTWPSRGWIASSPSSTSRATRRSSWGCPSLRSWIATRWANRRRSAPSSATSSCLSLNPSGSSTLNWRYSIQSSIVFQSVFADCPALWCPTKRTRNITSTSPIEWAVKWLYFALPNVNYVSPRW